MIIEFSVKNFGSIKNTQTISFEATSGDDLGDYYIYRPLPGLRLLKLGIIYGPNASGKTTILKALDFLRNLIVDPVNKKNDVLKFEPFLFDEGYINSPTEMAISFVIKKIRYSYVVHFNKSHIIYEKLNYYPRNRMAELYTRTTNTRKEISSIAFGSTVKINSKEASSLEANTIWNNTLLGAATKTNVDVPELKEAINWFKAVLNPIITSKTDIINLTIDKIQLDKKFRKRVVELINKADVQIGDIEVILREEIMEEKFLEYLANIAEPNELEKEFLREGKITRIDIEFLHSIIAKGKTSVGYLRKEYESKGTMQYFGLSGVLTELIEKNEIQSIDEIESSLHPDLMKQLIMLFLANAKSAQLIVTTHNISFLDEKDILRNDSVWFTQKKEDGSTEIYSLSDFDSSIFRKGSSVINAYKIGKLGAKPNLGSVFLTETSTNG